MAVMSRYKANRPETINLRFRSCNKYSGAIKKQMTRTEQLLSIGLLRIEDISKLINIGTDAVKYRIKSLGIIPFERWWYDEFQLEMIINYQVYKQNNYGNRIRISR